MALTARKIDDPNKARLFLVRLCRRPDRRKIVEYRRALGDVGRFDVGRVSDYRIVLYGMNGEESFHVEYSYLAGSSGGFGYDTNDVAVEEFMDGNRHIVKLTRPSRPSDHPNFLVLEP